MTRIIAFVTTKTRFKKDRDQSPGWQLPLTWTCPTLLYFLTVTVSFWAAVIRAALCRGWFWQKRARKDCQAGVRPCVGALTLPVIRVPVDRKSQKAASSSRPQIWSSPALHADTGTDCCHCDTSVFPPTCTCWSVPACYPCHPSCRRDRLGTFPSMELQTFEYHVARVLPWPGAKTEIK